MLENAERECCLCHEPIRDGEDYFIVKTRISTFNEKIAEIIEKFVVKQLHENNIISIPNNTYVIRHVNEVEVIVCAKKKQNHYVDSYLYYKETYAVDSVFIQSTELESGNDNGGRLFDKGKPEITFWEKCAIPMLVGIDFNAVNPITM